MKTLLLVLALLAGNAFAVAVPMTPPAGVSAAFSGQGFTTGSSFVGSFSAGSFNNTFTSNVGGRAVTMPSSMRMAANAGQFVGNAARMTPQGLVTAAIAAWLLSQGLEYLDGQWKKRVPDDPTAPIPGLYWSQGTNPAFGCYGSGSTCSWSAALAAMTMGIQQSWPGATVGAATQGEGNQWYLPITTTQGWYFPTAYYVTNLGARPMVEPATDEDWNKLALAPVPDAVANDAVQQGVPLPLQNPEFNPPYQDVPLGDPRVDPLTGKKMQDKARVTPQKDGKEANVDPFSQEVDANGDPVKDPEGNDKPPEEKKNPDPCDTAKDRLSCLDKGETEDVTLEKQNQGVSITPVSVGGGGSCPADKSISLHGGTAVFSYQPICQLATMINPLVVAFAWLGAGFILIGAFRE